MPFKPSADAPRCAVVDLGSNSVRLVVYEGACRNPVAIFNEKAVLRLGRGLQATGRLNEEGMAQALTVLHRYHAVARAMGADAVRDARHRRGARCRATARTSSPACRRACPTCRSAFCPACRRRNISAMGVLCGIPTADGILADIGGGSLELVRLDRGARGVSHTLSLGAIRLAERAGGDPVRARAIAEADLATVPWLAEGANCDLYLVGGAWRALARIHMAQTGYPLQMVHHYTIGREEARDLTGVIAGAGRRALERLPGLSRRRIDDLPYRRGGAAARAARDRRASRRVQRERTARGLVHAAHADAIRAEDPLLAAGREFAARLGRDPKLPPALFAWTDPLFPAEVGEARRLREAACWMSDIGSHDHPEFRAEQAFLRVLRQPGIGLDHHARAFLALAIAMRYEVDTEAPFLRPARLLLDVSSTHRAEVLGVALRLAYTLSAGTPDLLAGTGLRLAGSRLILRLEEDSGVFAGESVMRRLDRLAQAVGLEAATEAVRERAA